MVYLLYVHGSNLLPLQISSEPTSLSFIKFQAGTEYNVKKNKASKTQFQVKIIFLDSILFTNEISFFPKLKFNSVQVKFSIAVSEIFIR